MKRLFRVAGRSIVMSLLALLSWSILGTRPLFYLAVFLTTYTGVMVSLVLKASDSIAVMAHVQHSVVQMKSQDVLSVVLEGIPRRSPLSIRFQTLLPEYVIPESSSSHEQTYTTQFHVNRRGVYEVGGGMLTVTDPLRMFNVSKRVPPGVQLTVFPPVLPLEKLRISLTSPLDGQRVKFAPNYDVSQLAGVRPYQNDSMNRIHWKMSAHRRRTHGQGVLPIGFKDRHCAPQFNVAARTQLYHGDIRGLYDYGGRQHPSICLRP